MFSNHVTQFYLRLMSISCSRKIVVNLSIDCLFFFFFNDTATTEIYTLSLHDALPISLTAASASQGNHARTTVPWPGGRSEEHTSELQSRRDLVCRLLLEKKKKDK